MKDYRHILLTLWNPLRFSIGVLGCLVLFSVCSLPDIPLQPDLSLSLQSQSLVSGAFETLVAESGHRIRVYQDGKRLLEDVPFIQQGSDNTCGQAVNTMLLNYWGISLPYSQVIQESNPRNLPTTGQAIVHYLRKKGLVAQEYRKGTLYNLVAEINLGHPVIVLLDFGRLAETHYVVVVGYNTHKKSIIFHDSVAGPYIEVDEQTFESQWANPSLKRLPVLGGKNYERLLIQVHRNN